MRSSLGAGDDNEDDVSHARGFCRAQRMCVCDLNRAETMDETDADARQARCATAAAEERCRDDEAVGFARTRAKAQSDRRGVRGRAAAPWIRFRAPTLQRELSRRIKAATATYDNALEVFAAGVSELETAYATAQKQHDDAVNIHRNGGRGEGGGGGSAPCAPCSACPSVRARRMSARRHNLCAVIHPPTDPR